MQEMSKAARSRMMAEGAESGLQNADRCAPRGHPHILTTGLAAQYRGQLIIWTSQSVISALPLFRSLPLSYFVLEYDCFNGEDAKGEASLEI